MNNLKINTFNNFGRSKKIENNKNKENYNKTESNMAAKAAFGLSLITLATAAGLYYFSGGKKNFKPLKGNYFISQTTHDTTGVMETRTMSDISDFNSITKTFSNDLSRYTTETTPPKLEITTKSGQPEYVVVNDTLK